MTDTLSDREAEVFSLLAHAPSYEEVAEQLGISRRTVRFHIEKIRHKLGAQQYHQLCAASYLHSLTTAWETSTGSRSREMPASRNSHTSSRPARTVGSAGARPS
ncbi:helix-turn-helix transcriptional regulator [Streptomyces sp. NPDC005231]